MSNSKVSINVEIGKSLHDLSLELVNGKYDGNYSKYVSALIAEDLSRNYVSNVDDLDEILEIIKDNFVSDLLDDSSTYVSVNSYLKEIPRDDRIVEIKNIVNGDKVKCIRLFCNYLEDGGYVYANPKEKRILTDMMMNSDYFYEEVMKVFG